MKTFSYTIKDAQGIHARPAGELVKAAKGFSSEIKIKKECSWWNRPMAWKPSLSPMTEQLHAVPESTGMIPYSFMPPDFRVLKNSA